jgi:molybdopterin molybdotransferase
MTKKLIDDCFQHARDRLSHAEALAILHERVTPVTARERVGLSAAAGRILATSVSAPGPVPAHTNAAVDGFAFAAQDYDSERGSELPVAGRAAAGHPLMEPVAKGSAVRIFTGAIMPAGCNTVVMQEDVSLSGSPAGLRVRIPPGLKAGANTRRAGEDLKVGEQLFAPGHALRPQDLAALASIGLAEVTCYKPLEVAIVSSGDEVIRPGAASLRLGQVYDANAPMLMALVASSGARCTDCGVLPDRLDALMSRLSEAAARNHVILTSGGASLGEEDHMIAALDRLGKRHLWQLAVKPGRPMSFGQIGDCVVVGLPGNPVAVFVCFLMYVWPLLRRLGGAPWREPRRFRLKAAFSFSGRKRGRREFWRGTLVELPGGELAVAKFERDGSGLISGLRAADGLIDIPEEVGDVREGDEVAFIPFAEFGIIGGSARFAVPT